MSVAQVDIHLWFDCPHCEETLDLFDESDCEELGGADYHGSWHMIKEWIKGARKQREQEGTCGKCGKTFIVDEIEY